jgi:hypothetical protein
MTLINGTTTTSSQLLVSNFEKPILFTMIGSTAIPNANNSIESNDIINGIINNNQIKSNINPIAVQTNDLNGVNADTCCYANPINGETQLDSNLLNTTLQSNSQMSQTFNPISEVSMDNISQTSEQNTVDKNVNNDNKNDFKSESLIANSNPTDIIMSEPVSLPETQYLPLNSFNTIPANNSVLINNTLEPTISSTPLTDIPPIVCDPISNLLERIPSSQIIPTTLSVMPSEPALTLANSLTNEFESKPTASVESIPIKSIISENPVLASTVTTTPITQASNISALSEMSDAELLSFINPAAFDQSMCSSKYKFNEYLI